MKPTLGLQYAEDAPNDCHSSVRLPRVALIGNTLNTMGGGERVTANMLLALRELGAKVTLFTWDRLMPNLVDRSFSDSIRLSEKIDDVRPLGIGFRELRKVNSMNGIAAAAFGSLRLMRNFDLVVNSQGNTVPTLAHVSYVHFPTFALLRPELSEVAEQHLPAYASSRIDMMRMGLRYRLYKFLLGRSRLLLVNSKFTKMLLEKAVDNEARVLYPPVEVNRIAESSNSPNRDDVVVTISHFRRDKYLEAVPIIAAHVEKAKFLIIGHAHSRDYIRQIAGLARRYKVEDRVVLMTDCSRDQLLNMLAKAKVYLHTMPYEHFGLSVVEGMAAGLVPVVHASGGPYLDILDGKQGLYGYAYKDVEEAASYIDELLTNEALRSELAERAMERASLFDAENFKRNLIELLDIYLKRDANK